MAIKKRSSYTKIDKSTANGRLSQTPPSLSPTFLSSFAPSEAAQTPNPTKRPKTSSTPATAKPAVRPSSKQSPQEDSPLSTSSKNSPLPRKLPNKKQPPTFPKHLKTPPIYDTAAAPAIGDTAPIRLRNRGYSTHAMKSHGEYATAFFSNSPSRHSQSYKITKGATLRSRLQHTNLFFSNALTHYRTAHPRPMHAFATRSIAIIYAASRIYTFLDDAISETCLNADDIFISSFSKTSSFSQK